MAVEVDLHNCDEVVLIDERDLQVITTYRWALHPQGYASATRKGKAGETILMHRLITGAAKGQVVDHRNRKRLDNRRTNLRLGTYTNNAANSVGQSDSTSTYKGVSWHTKRRKWVAQIRRVGKTWFLGYFDDEHQAAVAYDNAARSFDGTYSCLNFGGQNNLKSA